MNIQLGRIEQLPMTNKSGGTLAFGDVVVVNTTTAQSVTTTTTAAYISGRVGVVIEPNGIMDNATGMIAFSGYVPQINLSGSASIGDLIKTTTVAGQGVRHAEPSVVGDFAQAIGTGTTPPALLFGYVAGIAAQTGLTLLESHTASSSASLDFTTAISSSYDEYIFELLNIIPATSNTDLYLRVSTDGGSTYVSGTSYSSITFAHDNSGSAITGSTSAAQMAMRGNAEISNNANWGINATLRLYSPASAIYKRINGGFNYLNSAGNMASGDFSGSYNASTAVNAIRFLFSSGNIASGTIRCYGVAK